MRLLTGLEQPAEHRQPADEIGDAADQQHHHARHLLILQRARAVMAVEWAGAVPISAPSRVMCIEVTSSAITPAAR